MNDVASVYGSAADWVMVILTLVGGYSVLLTLKSQQEVQNQQNEIFRLSIKPEVIIETDPFTMTSGPNPQNFDFIIDNADIYDFKVEIERAADRMNITWPIFFMHSINLQKGARQHTVFVYDGPTDRLNNKFDVNLIFLKMNFKDALGNEYEKHFRMYINMPLWSEPAKLVKRAEIKN